MPAIPKDEKGNPIYPQTNEESKPITNASSSAKDNKKNSDKNDPRRVLANSGGSSYLEITPWEGVDVSAYIYFRMFSYERGRQAGRLEDGQPVPHDKSIDFFGGDKTEYKGSIVLPLTQPINMAYQVNWDTFDNPLTGEAFAKGAIEAGKKIVAAIPTNVATSFAKAAGTAVLDTADNYSEYLANAGANELERIANLDTELVLQGVGLRKHTFEFLLTPRNKYESDTILEIIKKFKIAQSPPKATGGGLEYPYEFSIYFMDGRPGREGQPLKIPTIPDCACTHINVTYNPQLIRFNEDQTAIQYRLSLQFVEHQTLTRDDIEEGGF